jgi:ABC-type dipeptide/oligopeptide/nickel transport system permease component
MSYIIRKTAGLIITLLMVSIFVFLAFDLIPGDPVRQVLGTEASEELVQAMREDMGLNRPLHIRYGEWVFNFIRGDFGTSFRYHISVNEIIGGRLPITLTLTVFSFVMVLLLAIPMGLIGAYYERKLPDRLLLMGNQVVMAVPSFFAGMLLTLLFGLVLRWFTPGGFISYQENIWGFFGFLILPAIAIALPRGAMIAKVFRNSLLAEMNKEYVRTALSRGNSRFRTLIVHVFKNGFSPIITMLGMTIAEIITSSIIIEQVFGLPGLGRVLITSISNRDYPTVKVIIVLLALLILVLNVLVDILYQRLDKRIEI